MTEILLHSLGGRAAPAELAPALNTIAELPDPFRAQFGEIVASTLDPIPEDQLDNRIIRLCRKADLDPAKAAPPIKATRFVIRNAASQNTSSENLAADLHTLCPEHDVAALILPIYEQARMSLRQEVLAGSLRAHGNLLNGLEWRVDTIGASNLGSEINMPVALLTMHYQDRHQQGSFTVQLLPDMVAQLRDLCDQLLKR